MKTCLCNAAPRYQFEIKIKNCYSKLLFRKGNNKIEYQAYIWPELDNFHLNFLKNTSCILLHHWPKSIISCFNETSGSSSCGSSVSIYWLGNHVNVLIGLNKVASKSPPSYKSTKNLFEHPTACPLFLLFPAMQSCPHKLKHNIYKDFQYPYHVFSHGQSIRKSSLTIKIHLIIVTINHSTWICFCFLNLAVYYPSPIAAQQENLGGSDG